MTSVYDKNKVNDFSEELEKLLVKYGLKFSIGLRYTVQGIFPYMEVVEAEEKKTKKNEGLNNAN